MDFGNELLGTWHSTAPERADITFTSGTFHWGKDEGRWKLQGSEIWLLDPKQNTGTKWNIKIERTKDKINLIFASPEDFQYQGRGQYFYFQMTPPSMTHSFERRNTP